MVHIVNLRESPRLKSHLSASPLCLLSTCPLDWWRFSFFSASSSWQQANWRQGLCNTRNWILKTQQHSASHVTASTVQSRLSLQPYGLLPARFLCPWDFPGKNTGAGCHFLLQRIFWTQESNLHLLHWQVDSSPLRHLGKPSQCNRHLENIYGMVPDGVNEATWMNLIKGLLIFFSSSLYHCLDQHHNTNLSHIAHKQPSGFVAIWGWQL